VEPRSKPNQSKLTFKDIHMKVAIRFTKCVVALASLAALAPAAMANSTIVAPAPAAATASANLDFRVVIPRVLYIRIGNGVAGTGGTVNLMDMSPAAANVGDGTAVAATGGDQGPAGVTVRIYGNGNAPITLNSATTGQLSTGVVGAPTLGWNNITVTPAALAATTAGFTNGAITHPAFNNAAAGGAGTATVLNPVGGSVRQEGRWDIAYTNTALPAAGTYGGTVANNGRVTYTVSMP
jgi:hypothetical protein